MHGAAGRDVFLLYNPAAGTLREGHLDLGVTKGRARDEGCFNARMAHFWIGDIDGDGLTDIGVVDEEIRCPDGRDRYEGEVYEQHFVRWYRYTQSGWKLDPDANMPDRYAELPLIGIELSPVDFVVKMIWRSYDPADWRSPPRYVPAYRKKLISKDQLKSPKASQPQP
jgi:hypothetical protein